MKKIRLNRFDILLLVIAVVLIAGTCLKFLVLDHTTVTTQTQTASYQMKIAGVRQYTVDALQTGDTVYDNDGKASVGVITDISVSPAQTQITRSDGTVIMGTAENKYDVILTISAEGTMTDSAFEVGSYDLYVNTTGTFYTKYCIWSSTITSIG